ncbi:MAG TPA: thioredoxin family protein [Coriobacteriia bacterium]|jgi:thioredoxin-like negative regulator of GroEL
MKPVVDGLAKRYAGRIEFRRLDANAAATQQLADTFGVQYVPTFVFIGKDGNRADQVVGEISEQDLVRKLDALASK